MKEEIIYRPLTPADFDQIITLGNHVHGDGYLDTDIITGWYKKGLAHGLNASFVAYHGEKLVGFRVTFSANTWEIDKWCSPDLWKVKPELACYFKCNTVDENYRGFGIGGQLLKHSISEAKKQGATAGVAHLWKQSPGNSAVSYFTRCGGEHVQSHPDKWNQLSKEGYDCILCGFDCHCEAAEMIIYF